MEHEERYEPKYIQGFSVKARERYMKVHSQQTPLRKTVSRYGTHSRQGKAYLIIRLPKKWADGLGLEAHDNFEWTIISYDPVVLQLRKLDAGDSA